MRGDILPTGYLPAAVAAAAVAGAALVAVWLYIRRRLPALFGAPGLANAPSTSESRPQRPADPSIKTLEASENDTTVAVPPAVLTSSASRGSNGGHLRHRRYRQKHLLENSVKPSSHTLGQTDSKDMTRNSEQTDKLPAMEDESANFVCPMGEGNHSHPSTSPLLPSMCPSTHIGAGTAPNTACPRLTYEMKTGSAAYQKQARLPLDSHALDADLVTAFCPFGFDGDDASADEDEKLPGSTIHSDEILDCSSCRASGTAEHQCPQMEHHGRLVKVNQHIASSNRSNQSEDNGQRLTASERKEALRSAPAQLSASEQAAEAEACKEQLAAILELMKKQGGVFSQDDIDGVGSQLKLYI